MAALLGAFYGSIAFSMLIGALDSAFRPYPDDMSMWLLYAVPAGAIFGSITGCAFHLVAQQQNKAAALVSIIAALGLGYLHLMLIPDAMHRMSSPLFSKTAIATYAYAQYGPGLLWSVLLFAFGLRCCFKVSKT